MDNGESCTAVQMYLVQMYCTKMMKIVCFTLCAFYHNKKNILKILLMVHTHIATGPLYFK